MNLKEHFKAQLIKLIAEENNKDKNSKSKEKIEKERKKHFKEKERNEKEKWEGDMDVSDRRKNI